MTTQSKPKFVWTHVKAENVDKLINQAVGKVKAMQTAVQYASVAVLLHAQKHGDYSKANDLVKALGKGVRAKALVEFFVKYGGLSVGSESEGFTAWKGKEAIDIEGAKAQPWWDLKPEPIFKGFDLHDQIANLVAKAEKMQQEAANDPAKAKLISISKEDLSKLKAIA